MFQEVADRLARAGSLVIICHVNPDGDSLGASAALARAARAAGKTARVLPGEVPPRYEFLLAGQDVAPREQFASLADDVDALVVLDTSSHDQLGDLADDVRRLREKVVVIDHHATSDDLADDQWVDTTAAAAGLMVGELLDRLAWPIDLHTARCLATAVMSDTGWLRFSNTDGRCIRAVARWVEMGVATDTLYDRLYQRDRLERILLLRQMLDSLELHFDDRLAVMALREADFRAAGARQDETDNLINESLRIATVEIAVLLSQAPELTRVSLRSREQVDVSRVAADFGGGGHVRAAGFKSERPLDELLPAILVACGEALDAAGDPNANAPST
jgi:phosphoesterase RecJ-like protein